jgi:hypothetical protein
MALALVFAMQAPEARAQENGYAVVVIRNPTNATVHYKLKWGQDSDWQNFSLSPHTYLCHSYPLDEDARAPRPYIEFDSVLGDGYYTPQSYSLGFYAAACPGYAQGKKYAFRASGYYLDIYNC